MTKPKIFITRAIPSQALSILEVSVDVQIWPEPEPPPYETILEQVSQVDGLFTMLTDKIDAPVIRAGRSHLKVISQMAVGYDNIDIAAATSSKIPVGHTPGVLTETTADLAWGLLMAAARRITEADHEVHQGIWRSWGPDVLTGQDVHGATLGIIGLGRIGQAVARRARGFNMRLIYTDTTRNETAEKELGMEYVSLDDLLRQSDFVTIHVYLSPQTHHLIGEPQLNLMKPTSTLINTARGPIVDPDALYNALRQGVLFAAGLDVFDPEPIPANHPLLKLPNFVITPHIASASKQTRILMARMAAENILAGLSDLPLPYCVNPQIYSK